MKLTLDALMVVDAINKKGSFAAAAQALHRVPSAVTYTVRKLEQDLGVSLFDRSGHRATLTLAGEELQHQGERLLKAARALQGQVQRVATGWEHTLHIAVDNMIPMVNLMPHLEAFYKVQTGTGVQLLHEVYGGSWDALATNRADLVLGVPPEGPVGGGFSLRPLGSVELVFAVAPHHPLAKLPEPLSNEAILEYRAVSVADSSRSLPPRTAGLLTGQEVLTVPNIETKIAMQEASIGVGYIPRHLAQASLEAGRLLIKQVESSREGGVISMAWRSGEKGKALSWFLKRFESETVREQLIAPSLSKIS